MIINDCVLDLENSIDVEPGAATWIDQSRYKDNGTITAGAGGWVQLPSGLWVMQFDGAATVVDLGNDPSVMQDVLTISCWVKYEDTGMWNPFVTWKNGTDRPGILFEAAANSPIMYFGATNYRYFTGAPLVNDGTWRMFTCLITGWGTNDILNNTMYVDATALTPGAFNNAGAPNAKVNLYLGRTATSLNGKIALNRWWNYLLTPGQIRNNYEKTKYLFGRFD